MEDDKIKQLFDGYAPDMNTEFMRELERKLDAVEMVKARQRQLRAQTRRACVAAVATGFAAGFLSALAMPHISAAMQSLHLNLPPAYQMLPTWLAIASATILSSLAAYSLTSKSGSVY